MGMLQLMLKNIVNGFPIREFVIFENFQQTVLPSAAVPSERASRQGLKETENILGK